MHADDLWHSPKTSSRLLRTLLFPASLLYGLGWEAYLATYRLGFKRAQEPHSAVYCVGNLKVGGSGKTPVTLAIAKALRSQGKQVVVSSSGYGSPRSEAASLAPAGRLTPSEWGDEAAMLRWLDPELNLVVGRDRVRAAELVHQSHPQAVMLMDDGFQHLRIKTHLSILLDPLKPSNSFCLPAGPYREPRRNRARATIRIPGELNVSYSPTRLVTLLGEVEWPARYSVLCALGNPIRFLADLARDCPPGDRLLEVKTLPDHDPLTAGSLLRSFPRDSPIVVTAKDWVKLRERTDVAEYNFLTATQEARVEPLELLYEYLSHGE